MRKYTHVCCSGCGIEFQKENRYIKVAEKKGRKHYCSLKCQGKATRDEKLSGWVNSEENKNLVRSMAGNRRDEYSPFRHLLKSCKTRTNKSGNLKGDFDLDLPYMKQLWEQQNGKCVITQVDLQLKRSYNKNFQASLDRIDSNKGYVKGNVRYISVSANWLKNNLDDEHLKEFIRICKMVVN